MAYVLLLFVEKQKSMEPKLEQRYKQLKSQAKHLMKIGDIKAYVAKLIEVEKAKQLIIVQ